jgi:hypothetical protein
VRSQRPFVQPLLIVEGGDTDHKGCGACSQVLKPPFSMVTAPPRTPALTGSFTTLR